MSDGEYGEPSGGHTPESQQQQYVGEENEPSNVTERKPRAMQRVSTDASSDFPRMGLRLPPFWPDDPEVWFAQIEALFANAGVVSESVKFNYVVGNLDQQYITEVKDILLRPPAAFRYEKLKQELVKRLTTSKQHKVKQLLMHEQLGDRKPSQFLRHLRSLAGQNVPEDFLQTIWTSRLPENIQALLATQKNASLETLAELADQVQDIASPTRHVAATADHGSTISVMANEIAELRRMVKDLTVQLNRSPRPRDRNQQRSRSRSSKRSESAYRKHPLCWYHERFGSRSTRCIKPCDFTTSGNAQGSP